MMEKKLFVKLVKQVNNILIILNIYIIRTMKKTQKKLYVQQKKRYLKKW